MPKRNVPELRLAGFDGEWDNKKLREIGTAYGGLTGKAKADFGHGNAHYITYMDVFANTRILNARNCGTVEIDPKQTEVKFGDALFTVSSEVPEEVGMSSVWLVNMPNTYLNSFCFGFRPHATVQSDFFAYALRSPSIRQQFTTLAQGISRFNISKHKTLDINVSLPNAGNEQKAIGAVFSDLDAVIEKHEQRHRALQQTRSALMQRMFPQEGETEPRLRLEGFEGEWKRKTVKQVAPLQRGFDLPNSKLKTGDVPVVMSNGIENYHSTPKVQGPGVVTGRSGTIGKLQYIEQDYWPHNTTLWVTNFHNNNPRFIYFLFESIKLEKFASGSGVPTLNRNDVHDSSVTIPPALAEQEAIGAVFSKLDGLIAAEAKLVEKLKQAKTALLQKMFV